MAGDSPTPTHRAKLGLRGRAMKNFHMCTYPIRTGRKVCATGSNMKHWTSELAFQPTGTCSAAIAFHRCLVKSLCQQCWTLNSHTTHSRINAAFLCPVSRGRRRECIAPACLLGTHLLKSLVTITVAAVLPAGPRSSCR